MPCYTTTMIAPLTGALQGSEDWGVFTAASGPLPQYARAIKLTEADTEAGSTALTVTKSDGTSASTGELAVGVFEPIIGIKEITAVGAGVLEYRVYY